MAKQPKPDRESRGERKHKEEEATATIDTGATDARGGSSQGTLEELQRRDDAAALDRILGTSGVQAERGQRPADPVAESRAD